MKTSNKYLLKLSLVFLSLLCMSQAKATIFSLPNDMQSITGTLNWYPHEKANNEKGLTINTYVPRSANLLYSSHTREYQNNFKYSLNGNTYQVSAQINQSRAIGFKIQKGYNATVKLLFVGKRDRNIEIFKNTTYDDSDNMTSYTYHYPGIGADSKSLNTLTEFTKTIDAGTYWIKGSGDIYLVGIEIAASEAIVVTTIPDTNQSQCLWYSTGSQLNGSNNYFSSSRVYYTGNASTISTGNNVNINGRSVAAFSINSGDKIGFKVREVENADLYRIRIHSNNNSTELLKKGIDTNHLTTVSGGYVTDLGSGSYLLTYDLTPSETENQTFWIDAPANMLLGGFDLGANIQNGQTPGINVSSNGSWTTTTTYEDNDTSKNVYQNVSNANGGNGYKALVSSSCTSGNVCVYGPAMILNESSANQNAVMINQKCGLTLKIPAYAKITVNYAPVSTSANGPLLCIKKGNNVTSADIVAASTGNTSGTLTYTNNSTDTESLWIVGGSNDYVYVSGFTIDAPTAHLLNALGRDYFWYYNGGDGLFTDSYESGNNIYRHMPGNNIGRNSTEIWINGKAVGGDYYDSTNQTQAYRSGSYKLSKDDAIGFKLEKGKKYRVNIYSNVPTTSTLYTGEVVDVATCVAYTSCEPIKTVTNGDTSGYLTTYIIDLTSAGDNQTYWVKFPDAQSTNGWTLGGFDILPFNNTTQAAGLTNFTGSSWYIADQTLQNKDNALEANFQSQTPALTKTPIPVLPTGTLNNVYVYGMDDPINLVQADSKNTIMLNQNNAVAVKLKANSTLTTTITTGSINYVKMKKGSDLASATDLTVTSSGTLPYITYSYTPTEDEIVWITGANNNYVFFSGINVALPSVTIENTIDADYIWYASGELTEGATDYNTSTPKTYYIGSTLAHNGASMLVNNVSKAGYEFTNESYLGFKVAANKTGIINVFYAQEASVQLLTGASITEATSIPSSELAVNNFTRIENGGHMVTYKFDTTSSTDPVTFWITGNGSIGGFEVMFNQTRSGVDIPTISTVAWNTGNSNNKINNQKDGAETTYVYSGSVGTNKPYAQFRENPGRVRNTFGSNTGIMYDANNHLAFKLPANKAVTLTLHLLGESDKGLKVVKGATLADALAATPLYNIYPKNDFTAITSEVLKFNTHATDEETYWIIGINDQVTYFQGYNISTTAITQELAPIDSYHIYRASENLAAGSTTAGDENMLDNNYMQYVGDGVSLTSNNVNVQGQTTPTLDMTNSDYLTFKVAAGKEGQIKVYIDEDDCGILSTSVLNAGWDSSFDATTKTITFDKAWTGRGWYFGTGTNARDLSGYGLVDIELAAPASTLARIVVEDVNGVSITGPAVAIGGEHLTINLNQTATETKDGTEYTFDSSKIAQVYIQCTSISNGNTLVLKSATIAPNVKITQDTQTGAELSITNVDSSVNRTVVMVYDIDLSTASDPMQYWLNTTADVAAVEVTFDNVNHLCVVDWFVNKDSKMIVGSDDPHWVYQYSTNQSTYPSGYDEYATLYVSSGRPVHLSTLMPQAVIDVENWIAAVETAGKTGDTIDESKDWARDIKNSYGKHTVNFELSTSGSGGGKITFNRNMMKGKRTSLSGDIYAWYSREVMMPTLDKIQDGTWTVNQNHIENIKITATRKKSDGSGDTYTEDGKSGVWKVYIRLVYLNAPVVSGTTLSTNDGETITITGVSSSLLNNHGCTSPEAIYYTTNSDDPENLSILSDANHSATHTYSSAFSVKDNCIVKAAQYITTPYSFYIDRDRGVNSETSHTLKVVSPDHMIKFDRENVVYVHDKVTGDGGNFDEKDGGYMLTLPLNTTDPYVHFMFGSDKRKYFRSLGPQSSTNKWQFNTGWVKWAPSDDSGYTTYMDPYEFEFEGKQPDGYNANPNTECNDGIGGRTTEDGGLFLAPIAGDFFRMEPEYDGVFTLWIRQNGAVDHDNQENGQITRRPNYVVDENGRIMRSSTVVPTARHHLGINGMYAVNSGVSEFRSSFEHTWEFGVAGSLYPDLAPDRYTVSDDNPYLIDANGINDYRSAYMLYSMWYDGLPLNATRSNITSAGHVSRYEQMSSRPLYRDDWMYNKEMNVLGLDNKFAKYGYEVPNFTYIRYRIPVKAGKSYYLGGRGTKNGFVAMMFEPLEANTNAGGDKINKYRYADNPDVVEDDDLGAILDWDVTDTDARKNNTNVYDQTNALATYTGQTNTVSTITLTQEGTSNSTTLNDLTLHDLDSKGNIVGQTVNFTVDRTFKAGYWHPIVLPFSVSETRMKEIFGDGVQVLYLDPGTHYYGHEEEDDGYWRSCIKPAIEYSQLDFTLHRYQMLYANVPAFVKPTFTWTAGKAATEHRPTPVNGVVEGYTFKRVTIEKSNLRMNSSEEINFGADCIGYAIGGGYEVVGTYDCMTPATDMYYVTNTTSGSSSEASLVHAKNGGAKMRGTRVWIRPIPGIDVPPIRVVGMNDFTNEQLTDSDVSAIVDIVADADPIDMYDDNNVYDMLGRVIGYGTTEGLPQGVYIFRGHKVYVR